MARVPTVAGYKLLKTTSLRVSQDAAVALRNELEEYIRELGNQAVRIAEHSGRKTLLAQDVLFAKRHLKK